MNAVVIYDSRYGNTEMIARVIGMVLGATVCHVDLVQPNDLSGSDLLVLGSPTHGGFHSEKIEALLKDTDTLDECKTMVFDTRTKRTLFGYAAPKMAKKLSRKGAVLVVPPEGFYVMGVEGPLNEGEMERAEIWARQSVSMNGDHAVQIKDLLEWKSP